MASAGVRSVAVLAGVLLAGVGAAAAQAGGEDLDTEASLHGYQEVPAISTDGTGSFRASVSSDGERVRYRLRYEDVSSPVTQAHIHFGQVGVNGAVTVFLCSNLGNAPAGTPACPAQEGVVTGTFTAAQVTAMAAAQGIAAGELDEVLRAMEAGVTYANVHTTTFPGGEIRGQVQEND